MGCPPASKEGQAPLSPAWGLERLGVLYGIQAGTFLTSVGRFLSHEELPFVYALWAPEVALAVKHPPATSGDTRDKGSIPESGRSPGGGHSNPLQYPCLENPHGQRSLVGYSP